MAQILPVGIEADQGTPIASTMGSDGPAQDGVGGFQGIQDPLEGGGRRHRDPHLPLHSRQRPEMDGEEHPDLRAVGLLSVVPQGVVSHGSVWTSTERMGGRCSATAVQLSPSSAEA